MDRHREAHPSFVRTEQNDIELDMALQRAQFRLMAEMYRQRRPFAKRRKWPTVRTRDVVVPITAARRFRKAGEETP